jgi:hypothetical protein
MTSLLTQYLGQGDAADRPVTPDVSSGALAFYFATDTEELSYYDANDAAWQTLLTGSGALLAANNLSDVANASTARTNLGLAIGSDVQAYDAQLASVAGLAFASNALKVVRVNAGETDFELATVSGGATEATASEILIGSETGKYISPDKFRTATAPATLTSASNVTAVDFEAGRNFTFTINEDSQLGNPTNVQAGDSGLIYIIQDGTGGWTPTFASNWKAVGSLTADETAGAINVYSYFARSGTAITLTYLGVES